MASSFHDALHRLDDMRQQALKVLCTEKSGEALAIVQRLDRWPALFHGCICRCARAIRRYEKRVMR